MQMLSKSAFCPLCGAHGTVTLIEDRDPLRDSEGHRIEFRCSAASHCPPESELLKLWAADRMNSPASP